MTPSIPAMQLLHPSLCVDIAEAIRVDVLVSEEPLDGWIPPAHE